MGCFTFHHFTSENGVEAKTSKLGRKKNYLAWENGNNSKIHYEVFFKNLKKILCYVLVNQQVLRLHVINLFKKNDHYWGQCKNHSNNTCLIETHTLYFPS